MAPTPDNCPKQWPPSVLDPLITEREAAACRSITVERAMELIVENAALRLRVTELENDLAVRDGAFAQKLEAARCGR